MFAERYVRLVSGKSHTREKTRSPTNNMMSRNADLYQQKHMYYTLVWSYVQKWYIKYYTLVILFLMCLCVDGNWKAEFGGKCVAEQCFIMPTVRDMRTQAPTHEHTHTVWPNKLRNTRFVYICLVVVSGFWVLQVEGFRSMHIAVIGTAQYVWTRILVVTPEHPTTPHTLLTYVLVCMLNRTLYVARW